MFLAPPANKSTKISPCMSVESVAVIFLGLFVLNFFLAREVGRFYVMDLAWLLPLRAHGEFPLASRHLSQKNELDVALLFLSVLGEFAKLGKATISFVMLIRLSVRPPVYMEQLGSEWTDCHEILHLIVFRNLLRSLKFNAVCTVHHVSMCR